jgi:hypothetical protein
VRTPIPPDTGTPAYHRSTLHHALHSLLPQPPHAPHQLRPHLTPTPSQARFFGHATSWGHGASFQGAELYWSQKSFVADWDMYYHGSSVSAEFDPCMPLVFVPVPPVLSISDALSV